MSEIHYVWIGGSLPEFASYCLHGWRKLGYTPKLWRVEDIPQSAYLTKVIQLRHYHKASDYIRWYVMSHYGGIYLDVDVYLLKPLDNLPGSCLGFETYSGRVDTAVLKMEKDQTISREMLSRIERLSGMEDSREASAGLITSILRGKGLQGYSHQIQSINGVSLLPQDYFYPEVITKRSYCIHHRKSWWKSITQI